MRQIVLDTETTGIRVEDGHRIIEIGCLELVNRKLTGKRFHTYLNPQREIEAGAQAIHGIDYAFLQDKPLFTDIVTEFMQFIANDELIIHNAPFDLSFINYELQLARQSWKPVQEYCSVIDTLQLARQLHPGQRNNLDALCKRYKVDNSKRELHGALLDTYLLSQVYLAMTGGQGSFFDAPHAVPFLQEAAKEAMPLTNSSHHHLIILKANESELNEHYQYLDRLKKQGKCLWKSNGE